MRNSPGLKQVVFVGVIALAVAVSAAALGSIGGGNYTQSLFQDRELANAGFHIGNTGISTGDEIVYNGEDVVFEDDDDGSSGGGGGPGPRSSSDTDDDSDGDSIGNSDGDSIGNSDGGCVGNSACSIAAPSPVSWGWSLLESIEG